MRLGLALLFLRCSLVKLPEGIRAASSLPPTRGDAVGIVRCSLFVLANLRRHETVAPGRFSSRHMVGYEHRSAPLSGARPRAILNARSERLPATGSKKVLRSCRSMARSTAVRDRLHSSGQARPSRGTGMDVRAWLRGLGLESYAQCCSLRAVCLQQRLKGVLTERVLGLHRWPILMVARMMERG